jgi:nitrite reductase/ring-hydroxylating ferredoxin subunit
MPGWYNASEMKNPPQGRMKAVDVGSTKVFLVHGRSGIRAFEDRCGHVSAPLSLGTFRSGLIKCPLRSAVYDAETGEVRGPPITRREGASKLPPEMMETMAAMDPIMAQVRCETLRPFPVAVENGQVLVLV